MPPPDERQLVPGITLSAEGEVTVEPDLEDTLCELAISLQDATDLPVDVEHVVAAIVFGVQQGEILSHTRITTKDRGLADVLARQIQLIFDKYGGQVCEDDA